MKIRPHIILLAMLMAIFVLWVPAFAETEPPIQDAPTQLPHIEQTLAPNEELPPQETPPTQTAGAQWSENPPPWQLPAQTTEPTATPATEGDGSVNIIVCAYSTNGTPLKGYNINLGGETKKLNNEGIAEFENMAIKQSDISITAPNGTASIGILYMSRGSETVITDMAMGGKYGLNITNGAGTVYLTAIYNPDEAISLTASSKKPEPPKLSEKPTSIAPEETINSEKPTYTKKDETQNEYYEKQIFVRFKDTDGKPLKEINVTIKTDGGTIKGKTNATGRAELNGVPYGTSTLNLDGEIYYELTFKKGIQTYLDKSSTKNSIIFASIKAEKLYLTFEANRDAIILKEVSEKDGALSIYGLILITAVIVIGVILTIILIKRSASKTRPNFEYQYEKPQHSTGGKNKLGRRGDAPTDNHYNDRSRL